MRRKAGPGAEADAPFAGSLPGRIVLTGFMGTGKTAIGLALARAVKRPFVDLDRVIESSEGRSVAEIFARDGEEGFRAIEAREASRVARLPGTVIATGGGTLLFDPARDALLGDGTRVFVLTSSTDVLEKRLGPIRAHRPMLAGGDLRERIEALLAERAPRYASLGETVDTSERAVADVVAEILVRLGVVV
jgi:shikimate kinase